MNISDIIIVSQVSEDYTDSWYDWTTPVLLAGACMKSHFSEPNLNQTTYHKKPKARHGRAPMERIRCTPRPTGECVKSFLTHKTHFLDVYAKRHQLENAVRVKHERSERSSLKDKNKIKSSSPYLRLRVRLSHGASFMYYKSYCHMQSIGLRCPYPHGTCDMCQMYPFP